MITEFKLFLESSQNKEILNIYTDMSLDEDTVYIGAVAIDENDKEYRYADKLDVIEIYRCFKIAFPKGSTTTAEAISLYCTLSHFQLKENKNITVYIDSQGLFDTINDIFKSRK